MLPNGYTNINVCKTYGSSYIDTGIAPNSNTEIEIAFNISCSSSVATTRNFIFGSRDGTSNTSLGINLAKTYNNGYYFSYNTNNSLISTTKGNFSPVTSGGLFYDFPSLSVFRLKNKIASLTETPSYNALDESEIATFSGSRTMYLFGLNNNGNVLYATRNSGIAYCKIWQNGILVRNYKACLNDSTQYVGLYDFVSDTFYPVMKAEYDGVWVNVSPTVHGDGEVSGVTGYCACGELIAIPNEGSSFTRWEFNGETISTENPFPYDRYYLREKLGIATGGTFNPVAVFNKNAPQGANLGYKMAVFSCKPTSYNTSGGGVTFKYLQKTVLPIRSASISFDGKQKTTNKFVMMGSFSVEIGDYVYVYSQTGKNIFNGVIESFNDTTINCGEMRSVFDKDALFHPNGSKTIQYNGGTVKVTESLVSFALVEKYFHLLEGISDSSYTGETIYTPSIRFAPFFSEYRIVPVSYSLFANNYYGEPTRVNFPLIDNTEVKNLQTFVCDLFADLGIYVDNRTVPTKDVLDNAMVSYLQVGIFPRSASTEVLKIGSNNEQIKDVNIQEETDTTTYLIIFNSAGTSCRGVYFIDSEGSVVKENGNSVVNTYVPKIVMSDDNLNTVIQTNLSAGKYNHMITFNVALGGKTLKFDDFKINKRVDFYYGNKLYRSIVTALSYDIAENDDVIHSIKVTLGLARNNLTSKLNLRKVGKK